jgi:hypothetical protein
MKRNLTILLGVSLILAALSAYVFKQKYSPKLAAHSVALKYEPYKAKKKKMSKYDRIDKAIEQELEKTKDPTLGYVPKERLWAALDYAERRKNTGGGLRAPISSLAWEERGPNNVAGRTRAILVDANDPTGNTVWIGSVGGGLWKTTNMSAATPTWTVVDDMFTNLAVCAIAQNPATPNTIYFGTGEGWFNGDAIRGRGIFKSTDGGASWVLLPSTDNDTYYRIQKLVIKNVGATEYVFAATRLGGVQRSTDGGTTWTTVLSNGVNGGASERCADLEIGADGAIYATLGMFTTDGIYKSTDNGGSWTKLTSGLPSNGYNRIEIACAPSDANRIYAAFQSATTMSCSGVYKSTNGGSTWTAITNPTVFDGGNFASTQAWYNLTIGVDPNNADRVMMGGLDLVASTDAGSTWTIISQWYGGGGYQYVHADNHAIVYQPGSSAIAYFGNDGGIWRTVNANATTPSIVNKNLNYNVTQFYHSAIHPDAGSDYMLAGAQDNGSHRFSAPGINSTTRVTGGDGAFCHIDEDQPDIQITSYVYDDYFISNNGFGSYTEVEISTTANRGSFINPTDYDSRDNTLYGGDNAGGYHLVSNVGTTNGTATKTVAIFGTGVVTTVMVSPNTAKRVYFGLDNGKVVRVDNANGTPSATDISAGLPSGASVSSVAVERGNENHLLCSYSNYGVNSIWESTNGGASWSNIEGNMPDMPVRWIIFNPGNADQAIAATELGVWSTDNINGGSTDWGESNAGLARVRTDHLDTRTCDYTLIAATHGRGLFTSSSFEPPIVKFDNTSIAVAENSTSCPGYVEISIPVSISKTPSSSASVNVLVDGSTTATSPDDYQIMTALPLNFSSGPSVQNVVIRIYDDSAIESLENLVLGLQITNTGGTNAKLSCTPALANIAISDNDYAPSSYPQVIWSDDFSAYPNLSGSNPGAWTGFYGATTAKPNVWGIYDANCSNIINGKTAIIYDDITPSCGYNVTKTSSPIIQKPVNASGYTNLSVTFDWKCMGEYSSGTAWDYGEVGYYAGASGGTFTSIGGPYHNSSAVQTATVSLPASLDNTTFRLAFKWTNDDNTGSSPPFSVDNIVVKGNSAAPIQTAVNTANSDIQYVGANQTVHFFDDSGKIMATLKNNNATILGCLQVDVDRQGTSSNQFWNNTSADYLASKTFRITPLDAVSGIINYDLTIYYTQAEVNGYLASTSRVLGDIQMVKVESNQISVVTPATWASYIVDIYPTTNAAYKTTDHTFTSTGLGSFSGVGIGSPGTGLPIELLNLTGSFNGKAVLLAWKTASERDNKGFEVERSLDGRGFSKIGFVKGQGSSSGRHDYTFTDPEILQRTQYYRLKQVDNDGGFDYSKVVAVETSKRRAFASAQPNPFGSGGIRVTLGDSFSGSFRAVLMDIRGRQVWQANLNAKAGEQVEMAVPAELAKGTYLLRLVTGGGEEQSFKLVRN